MKQKKIEYYFEKMIHLLDENGCSIQAIQSFINHNYDYLLDEDQDVTKDIYFVYNNRNLYGIIWVNGNQYEWSIYDNDNFRRIRHYDEDEDAIIDMILGFANTDKVKKIVPEIGNMNLEDKIKVLKKLKLNSSGYHIQ